MCIVQKATKRLTRTANVFLLNCLLVLTDLLDAMHNIREKFEIKSHCQCTSKQNTQAGKLPAMNGVSQVSPKYVYTQLSVQMFCYLWIFVFEQYQPRFSLHMQCLNDIGVFEIH